jgi:hypothetical protein
MFQAIDAQFREAMPAALPMTRRARLDAARPAQGSHTKRTDP